MNGRTLGTNNNDRNKILSNHQENNVATTINHMKQQNRARQINNTNNNIIVDTFQSLLFYYSPTECHPWDDFLDFTRISMPKNGNCRWNYIKIWKRRLVTNMFQRFSGNYIWLWYNMNLITGVLTEKRLLIGLTLSLCSWFLLCLAVTYGTRRRRNFIDSMSLPRRQKQIQGESGHSFPVRNTL